MNRDRKYIRLTDWDYGSYSRDINFGLFPGRDTPWRVPTITIP
ncbi:MAG: hypothetical protein WC854_00255 [Bacteroidales bacterium]